MAKHDRSHCGASHRLTLVGDISLAARVAPSGPLEIATLPPAENALSPETPGMPQVVNMASTAGQTQVSDRQRAETMARAEVEQYWFTSKAGSTGFATATNTRNAVELSYGEQGMTVSSRRAQRQSPWQVLFTGRELKVDSVVMPLAGPTGVVTDQDRITGQLAPGCEEWFVNRATGIKHGFTVARPESLENPQSLTLSFTVNSDLSVEVDPKTDGFVFRNNLGRAKAAYRDLTVFDAGKEELPSSMTLSATEGASSSVISIQVDVTGAQWPIEIDPTMVTRVDEILAGDGAPGHEYGEASDGDGDILVVGAPGNESGKAYVYLKDEGGEGKWGETTTLSIPASESPSAGDRFGESVAVVERTSDEKTYIAVGAPQYGTGGAVFIFERNQGGQNAWGFVTKLVPDDVEAGDDFGCALDMKNNRLVVGAKNHGGCGAAYVYGESDGDFTENQKLTPPGNPTGAEFGAAVSLAEDKVGVGAPGEDSDTGAAYVFLQLLLNPLIFSLAATRFFSGHPAMGDRFGAAIALTLTLLAIGGPGVTGFPAGTQLTDRGAVWIFQFAVALAAWSHFAILFGTELGGLFGWSLAFGAFGDLIVGSPGATSTVGLIAGAAFLFLLNPLLNGFDAPTKVVPSTFIDAGMQLGTSVVLLGTFLFVLGAAYNLARGAMFLFILAATLLTFTLWQLLFFTQEMIDDPAQEEVVGPMGDPDKDKIPNSLEYGTNRNPTVHDPNAIEMEARMGAPLRATFEKSMVSSEGTVESRYSDPSLMMWHFFDEGPDANVLQHVVEEPGITRSRFVVEEPQNRPHERFYQLQHSF